MASLPGVSSKDAQLGPADAPDTKGTRFKLRLSYSQNYPHLVEQVWYTESM